MFPTLTYLKELLIYIGPGFAKIFPLIVSGVIVGTVGAWLIIKLGLFIFGAMMILIALQTINVGWHLLPYTDKVPFFHKWAR